VTDIDVLIAGAGPSGLVLAVELARRGVAFRIVERRPRRGTGTACPLVWRRTLDILSLQGADVAALRSAGVDVRRRVFTVLGETAVVDLSTAGPGRPACLSVPQWRVEHLLRRRLRELGGTVEYGCTASVRDAGPDGALVELTGPHGRQRVGAAWFVCATGAAEAGPAGTGDPAEADRATGVVRRLGVDVTLAPLRLFDPHGEHVVRAEAGFVGAVPLPGGRHRLSLAVPSGAPATGDEIRAAVTRVAGWRVASLDRTSLWWHRPVSWLAEAHRRGRILGVGDAVVRYPMPVMGLNSGIADAFNLGWKLAAVVGGEAGESLLDSYGDERRRAAVELLRRAERVAGFAAADAQVLLDRLRRNVFDARDEPVVRYGTGRLVDDRLADGAPESAAGTALPVLGVQGMELLAGHAGWTVLVPVTAAADEVRAVRDAATDLPRAAVRVAGAADTAVLAVRPDGHVGWRGRTDDLSDLERYARGVVGT
jgi:2-polyprenyl-6-methoxyphenol hydroxylase-like FAD-dependent oxidoreductase